MTGAGAVIANLKRLTTTATGRQTDDLINAAIAVNGATSWQVDHVLIDGNYTGGVFSYGSSDGKVTNSTIENTYADCIGNYHGSSNNLDDSNYIYDCGDDGVSVVSYQGEALNTHIAVSNNVVQANSWGRNFTAVGGDSITFTNNYADTNAADLACVYFASEAGSNSQGTTNATWTNGTLENCGNGTTGYSAFTILGQSAAYPNSNLVFESSYLDNPGNPGVWILNGSSSDISLINYEDVSSGDTFGNAGQVVQNSKGTSGCTGYTPTPVGVDGTIYPPPNP